MQLSNTINKMAERFGWQQANDYGERGYSITKEGGFILLGNYNDLSDKRAHGYKRIMDQIEAQGAELEWSDEWFVDGNGKAWRTSGDSYFWEPALMYCDGDYMTPDDGVEAAIEWAQDDPARNILNDAKLGGNGAAKLIEAGFVRHPESDAFFETGWHPGQTDSPMNVINTMRGIYGEDVELLIAVVENSQFYVRWAAYYKPEPVRVALGNNHSSDDMNLHDVVASMGDSPIFEAFNAAFPEFNTLEFEGASLDVEAAGLDMEYTSWCIDWIENNTPVYWEDGEPWVAEDANWPMGVIGEGGAQ